MNKNILIFIILIFLFATVMVCVFRPKTHKPIVFENRDFKLELISKNVEVPKNGDINFQMPEVEVPSSSVNFPEIIINENTSTEKNIKTQNSNKKDLNNRTEIQKPQPKTQIVSKNTKDKIQKQETAQKSQTPQKTEYKPVPKTEVVKVKPQETKTQEDVVKKDFGKTETKYLTEEEEIIAWNKWRSDLQNKLMSDSKIAAPIGTTFAFSFTVDKFGTISNLKTWSTNPSYTPLAVKVIKPLLLSYQKTYILNFPTGSKRVITNVNGGFTMARSSRYSSPSDYNDYERVTK